MAKANLLKNLRPGSFKMEDNGTTKEQANLESEEAMNQMLRKPWNTVYAISPDGEKYTAPQCLNGTPTSKISESDPYWKSEWLSLDAFLAQEESEEKAKAEAREQLKINPNSKAAQGALKLHTDNVSKHRRIRDIFGPNTSYHPNQLVSKHHLPKEGLCHKELMYRLACKISDLRVLNEKGELWMGPWDFIRWRIIVKLQSFLSFPAASGRDLIRGIIYKICDESGPEGSTRQYEDVLLRQAIIRSAGYQNRLASFNGQGNKTKAAGPGSRGHSRASTTSRPKNKPLALSTGRSQTASRVDKREKRAPRPSTYQGVNAYRVQQKARESTGNEEFKQ
ncbi:hypothetical protein F66182_3181 [Fusarium sp. NRRL 66182]|nr:hypothetical protein F66182_3181 [Fusarium sp. NRRL 66182]